MEDDASTSLDGKGLGNLRVVDLKLELEKRGLSKSGSKKDLVKRLKQQLEFEKLCEERKSGDFDRKLELDAATEQNEFVQQYLAQQQKRLELQALQKHDEGKEANISESRIATEESLDSDSDEIAQKSSDCDEPSDKQTEHEDGANTYATRAGSPEVKNSDVVEVDNEELNRFSSPVISENVNINQKYLELNRVKHVEKNQNSSQSLVDVKSENLRNESLSSYSINSQTSKDSENSSESAEIKYDSLPVSSSTLDCVQDQTDTLENIQHSDKEKSEVLFQNLSNVSDTEEHSFKSVQSSNITEQENVVSGSTFLNRSEDDAEKGPEDHTTLEGSSSVGKLTIQDNSSMESSVPYSLSDIQLPESPGHHLKYKDLKSEEGCIKQENNSDVIMDENSTSEANIQSNGVSTAVILNSSEEVASESESKSTISTVSPEKHNQRKESEENRQTDESSDIEHEKSDRSKKSSMCESPASKPSIGIEKNTPKEIKGKEQKSSKHHQSDDTDDSSDNEKTKHSHLDSKHKSHAKHKKALESPPSKTSIDIDENATKENTSKQKSKHHQSDESDKTSDSDKYKHGRLDSKHKSHIKHKKKLESLSLKSSLDKEGNNSKEMVSKEQKSSKHHDQSDESNRSSDSEKYKHSRLDLKHKSHAKHRKRNRHSRSRSSSSSSSQSSDSSPKRRHSKKSITVKSKNFENNENIKVSDKSPIKKRDEQKQDDSLPELPSAPSVSSKKRLKIKRDNVAIEVNIRNAESIESTSSKNEDSASNFHSVPEKPLKKESNEAKLSFTELPYVPRKVSLSNRKLSRKSSEDKGNDPKSKKSKWESFAAGQKVSQTISISTDSLKNWFPDFKLINEPSSMEVDLDEHSIPTEEKSSGLAHIDASYGNEFGVKQESTSHVDIEDTESQEANFEDSSEQGPVSKIIFIQNLVRPFTLNQLKELLKQYGKIVEDYFWIDKIKSKCFVMYEAEKEAVKARNALHNTRWPSSNPKILTVDFSNEEEMEQHKKGNELPPKPVIEPPVVETVEEIEPRASHSVEEHKRKDRERRKERERSKPQPPVREWDKDKVLQDSPERDRSTKDEKRSSDKKEKKESKKRPNEDTPAKLLDDLFQKTKNPPCIYWLPLTEEQAKQKEEAQKLRKLEREKRNQQLKEQEEAERRNKGGRSNRRSREKENRKSSTRSRSPVTRRR